MTRFEFCQWLQWSAYCVLAGIGIGILLTRWHDGTTKHHDGLEDSGYWSGCDDESML